MPDAPKPKLPAWMKWIGGIVATAVVTGLVPYIGGQILEDYRKLKASMAEGDAAVLQQVEELNRQREELTQRVIQLEATRKELDAQWQMLAVMRQTFERERNRRIDNEARLRVVELLQERTFSAKPAEGGGPTDMADLENAVRGLREAKEREVPALSPEDVKREAIMQMEQKK